MRRFQGVWPVLMGVGFAGASWAFANPNASRIERVWVTGCIVSLEIATFGLAQAIQTHAWVEDEQEAHREKDFGAAESVAGTHIVTHLVFFLAQLALLLFGGFAALTPPPPGTDPGHVSPVAWALTATLIFVECVLTFGIVWLVLRRRNLVRRVREIGGD